MTKKLTGREVVAAAGHATGWTLVADGGSSSVDHYQLGRNHIFVSYSVTGAITAASTPKSLIGARRVGKAAETPDFLRTHGTTTQDQR